MFILIFLLFLEATTPCVYATDTETYFARVMFEQVYLYKTPTDDDSVSNVYFELPKTYFVELTNSYDDTFFVAKYLDLTGYVKKTCVQAIDGIPTTPYLNNISFRVYAEMSTEIFSEPNKSDSSNLVGTIPLFTRNIQYYGAIKGQSLIEGRTNVWYYCKYTSDTTHYGYIYSDFCDEMPTIIENTEQVTYIDNPTFTIEIPPQNSIPITDNVVGIVIGILSIPAFIFVFMIIKGKHILTKEPTKNKEVIDY